MYESLFISTLLHADDPQGASIISVVYVHSLAPNMPNIIIKHLIIVWDFALLNQILRSRGISAGVSLLDAKDKRIIKAAADMIKLDDGGDSYHNGCIITIATIHKYIPRLDKGAIILIKRVSFKVQVIDPPVLQRVSRYAC